MKRRLPWLILLAAVLAVAIAVWESLRDATLPTESGHVPVISSHVSPFLAPASLPDIETGAAAPPVEAPRGHLPPEAKIAIHGTVVLEDGRPAPGVLVRAILDHGGLMLYPVPGKVTGPEGRFRLERVPARRVHLGLFPGLSKGLPPRELAKRSLQVTEREWGGDAGDTVDVGTLVLRGLATISGQVVDERGLPVEEARVEVTLTRDGMGYRKVRTGSDGRFEIPGLARGEYTVHASFEMPGIGWIHSLVQGVIPGEEALLLRLVQGPALFLRFFLGSHPDQPFELEGCRLRMEGGEHEIAFLPKAGATGRSSWRVPMRTGEWVLILHPVGYRRVDLGRVRVFADRDAEIDVFLEPE